MMTYLDLLLSFIKIGLFSFGGGYAMIPLIQKEIEMHGWMSSSEFVDIIAIAEMTPGPIAVNSATFVGYKTAGIIGSALATTGVALPSLVLILMVSKWFFKFKDNPIKIMIFYGIRPVITSLIASAAIFVAETAIIKEQITMKNLHYLFDEPTKIIDFGAIVILIITIVALVKHKLHPIIIIAMSGVIGVIIYYLLPLFQAVA